LAECLPDTLAALAAGHIDSYRARVLVEETRPLSDTPDLRARVESDLLEKAGRQTGAQLRATARRAVLAADPTTAEERHTRARAGRGIQPPVPEPDGMASCLIRVAAEDLAAFWTAIDAAARATRTSSPEDPRTLDQLRAAVTAEVARRITADGTWRRLLTDPATGALLDYGTNRYTPPADLVEHVNARDRTCRFPTCTHPAETCDFEHTTPASQGGSTSPGNGGPVHRKHHNDKTHHGWQLEQPEPGRFIWTAPTGHTYEVDPEIIGPLLGDLQPPNRSPTTSPPPQAEPDPPDPDPPPF
ncbi:MAG TPA: DUF222 domain-containing protein, partial [Jiangellaceae bacterium]